MGTHKVINTLDTDGKIEYFPFFCFRVQGVSIDGLRITDDTNYQKSTGQYTYLDEDDVSHTLKTYWMPQFDNYYTEPKIF